jgi:hypothetical protein
MKLFLILGLVSVCAARAWFQWFDDGKLTWGDFVALGIEGAAYLGMIGSIVFIEC